MKLRVRLHPAAKKNWLRLCRSSLWKIYHFRFSESVCGSTLAIRQCWTYCIRPISLYDPNFIIHVDATRKKTFFTANGTEAPHGLPAHKSLSAAPTIWNSLNWFKKFTSFRHFKRLLINFFIRNMVINNGKQTNTAKRTLSKHKRNIIISCISEHDSKKFKQSCTKLQIPT